MRYWSSSGSWWLSLPNDEDMHLDNIFFGNTHFFFFVLLKARALRMEKFERRASTTYDCGLLAAGAELGVKMEEQMCWSCLAYRVSKRRKRHLQSPWQREKDVTKKVQTVCLRGWDTGGDFWGMEDDECKSQCFLFCSHLIWFSCSAVNSLN